jgi:hypothetical protein
MYELTETLNGVVEPYRSVFHNLDDFIVRSANFPDAKSFADKYTDGTSEDAHAGMMRLWNQWNKLGVRGWSIIEPDGSSLTSYIARNIGARYIKNQGSVGTPWSDTEMIGGAGSYILKTNDRGMILLDADIEKQKIYLSQISVEHRGGGLGSKAMVAIKEYADQYKIPIIIYKVTNVKFFERFDWLIRKNSDDFIYEPE